MALSQVTTRRGHTTAFIVDGADYFSAHLDNGGVRIGLVGSVAYDIPAGHTDYARAVAAADESAVEVMVDEFFARFPA